MEIIPRIPSAYIYYIVINKNKSVFESIEILFKYCEEYKESSNFNDINTFIKFYDDIIKKANSIPKNIQLKDKEDVRGETIDARNNEFK